MSLYVPIDLPCPECDTPVPFRQYTSINADRMPAFREAVMDNTFGESTCPSCGTSFRIDPELTYFDEELGLWIVVKNFEEKINWPAAEEDTQAVWVQTFGPFAPGPMMALGAKLKTRVVFGWAGLREKILCAQHGIDDAALEVAKINLLAKGCGDPISDETAMRLAVVNEDTLEFVWLMGAWEVPMEGAELPRAMLDVIAEEPEVFGELLADVSGDYYVDMARALLDVEAPEEAAS